jgi:hypothetical protein
MEIGPNAIWFGLCHDHEDAKAYCRTFLQSNAENSEQLCPSLGPEEYEWKRAVTSAASILNMWKSLVGIADATILQEKRKQDPENKSLWTLKFTDLKANGTGPVHEITNISL